MLFFILSFTTEFCMHLSRDGVNHLDAIFLNATRWKLTENNYSNWSAFKTMWFTITVCITLLRITASQVNCLFSREDTHLNCLVTNMIWPASLLWCELCIILYKFVKVFHCTVVLVFSAFARDNKRLSYPLMCRILNQNEQLEQMTTFPYLGSLITEDGECITDRVVVSVSTPPSRDGLQTYQRLVSWKNANVSVSVIDISCPIPIFYAKFFRPQ